MNQDIENKIDEKLLVILNLIRTNNSADDVLKITQGFVNLSNGKCLLTNQGKTTTTKKGTGT